MTKNNVFRKGLVIAIIVCFIGAGVFPSISGSVIKKANFNDTQNQEFVPGEFIVKFKAEAVIDISESINGWISIGIPSIDVLNEKHPITYLERLFKSCKQQGVENHYLYNIFKFSVPQSSDVLSVVQEYLLDPLVVYAEPNYIVRACTTPNDPDFNLQWALHNTGQTGGTPDADIDAPEAWDIETGEPDVVIAIIDSGIDYTHPDLSDNIWINKDEIPGNGIDDDENGYVDDIRGWNFIHDDNNDPLDSTDTDENSFIDNIRSWDFVNDDNDPMDDNGHGTCCAGIASADTDNNIGMAGICWNCKIMAVKVLDSDTQGITVDLADGITYAADNDADVLSMSLGGYPPSSLLKNAVDYAYSQGAVLVAAAGNGATNEKFYPATFDNVIAVAATNYKDIKIDASNYGSWVDVAAPGWDIYTTDLDDDYILFSYTSSATPHVAGLSGLILSKNPSYSPAEVKSIIKANVDPYDSDVYIGTGRINAHKALIESNQAPTAPVIDGPTSGSVGTSYEYTFTTTDPNGDEVFYFIKWGDGDTEETAFYASGEEVKLSHIWNKMRTWVIKAKAKDAEGAESDWAELSVSMPKSKAINRPFLNFLQNFLEKHPILYQLMLRFLRL